MDNISTLTKEARKGGYISGYTKAMNIVNKSLERTRDTGMTDSERIIALLNDLIDNSFKNENDA